MLIPSSVDILRCIERTLDSVVAPALTGTSERSALATIGHMLRHVTLRIQFEGPMLVDDIARVRSLLARVRNFLRSVTPEVADGLALQANLTLLLAPPATDGGYRGVESLAAEAASLRQGVCDSLSFLQTQLSEGNPSAKAIYDELLCYVAWEVEQEARIIDPAFEGFGPRR